MFDFFYYNPRAKWIFGSVLLVLFTAIFIIQLSTKSDVKDIEVFSPKLNLQGIDGSVKIKFASNDLWVTARVSADIYSNDNIKTEDGFANLRNDYFMVRLAPYTDLKINEIKESESTIAINNTGGSVYYRTTAKKSSMKITFNNEDFSVIAKGNDTSFLVDTSSGFIVDVVDGNITIVDTKNNLTYKANRGSSFIYDKVVDTDIIRKSNLFLSRNLELDLKIFNNELDDIKSILNKLQTKSSNSWFDNDNRKRQRDIKETEALIITNLKKIREYIGKIDSITSGYISYNSSGSTAEEDEESVLLNMPDLLEKNYVVKPGDTIASIGIRLGYDWRVIARINELEPPYILQAGESLLLPIDEDELIVEEPFESDQEVMKPIPVISTEND